jgi:hypothetical protein
MIKYEKGRTKQQRIRQKYLQTTVKQLDKLPIVITLNPKIKPKGVQDISFLASNVLNPKSN